MANQRDRRASIAAIAARRAAKPRAATYLLVVSVHEHRGRRFVTLPDESLVAWFRRNWNRTDVEREEELRGHVYGLEGVFEAAKGPPPESDLALIEWIDREIYSESEYAVRLNYIRNETDDDEALITWYMFDEKFLAEPRAWDELPPRHRRDDVDEDLGNFGLDAFEKFRRSRATSEE